jgi:hypothetical protein
MSTEPTRADVLASDDVEGILSNWVRLLEDVLVLPLPALRQLIDAELAGKRRPQVLLRLYGRFNRLRAIEEKQKLLRGETLWVDGKLKW